MKNNQSVRQRTLEELVEIADSGTWGDDGTLGVDFPVLRSTNIADYRLTLNDPAWRVLPATDVLRRRLSAGDIIITKSSGSPDHIGKCAVFAEPDNGQAYYFSNFMLRLRANKKEADPRWLYYWLISDRGRFILQQMNSTTTGLRNLNVGQYLQQRLPSPPLPEQRRIADILDKADAIRRKRREAVALLPCLVDSVFANMFGDLPSKKSIYPVQALRPFIDAANGKSSRDVLSDSPTGIPVYGGNGVNGWSKTALYEEPVVVVGRVGQQCGITHLTSGPAWITDNAIAVRIKDADRLHPVYLESALQRSTLGHDVRYIDLPYINQSMILDLPLPLPPFEAQTVFAKRKQAIQNYIFRQTQVANETGSLFNSLVQRAFRGDL